MRYRRRVRADECTVVMSCHSDADVLDSIAEWLGIEATYVVSVDETEPENNGGFNGMHGDKAVPVVYTSLGTAWLDTFERVMQSTPDACAAMMDKFEEEVSRFGYSLKDHTEAPHAVQPVQD